VQVPQLRQANANVFPESRTVKFAEARYRPAVVGFDRGDDFFFGGRFAGFEGLPRQA
jgi:hypothetical protein